MIAVLLAAHEARGTTFVLMDEGELASRSVAVITGTVQEVETAADDASGGVNTYVSIEPQGVLAGAVPDGQVVLKETGGRIADREETVYGAPQYSPGEQVLVFLSRNPDGSLHTTGMAMGKYRLSASDAAQLGVSRTFGSGVSVLRRAAGRLAAAGQRPDTSSLEDVIARIHSTPSAEAASGYSAPVSWRPSGLDLLKKEHQASFSYLSSPARWFEPGSGNPVGFLIDPTGDPKIGAADSRAAVLQALTAWSSISSTMLHLEDAGETAPMGYAGCNGGNRVVFNDPNNEITDPTNCGGILAVGGYCASWETQTVNGMTYRRIGIGKVLMNNGWDKCAGWNACNLAEVLTHEIGHAIGLGHSEDGTATMSPSAHFDGRCGAVENDDVAGALSLYADPDMATFTPSPSPTPTVGAPAVAPATATRTATAVPTQTRIAPTGTPTSLRSKTPTRTRTATATRTKTRSVRPTATRTPSAIRTPTKTRTPYATRTRTTTRTPTRSKTPTRTRTATRTRTPTSTPAGLNEITGDDTRQATSGAEDWVERLIRSWWRLDP